MNNSYSVLSFSKILSGISKTLGVANQIIPLYQQTKPLIKNVKNVYNVMKKSSTTSTSGKPTVTNKKTIKTTIEKESTSGPQFFI